MNDLPPSRFEIVEERRRENLANVRALRANNESLKASIGFAEGVTRCAYRYHAALVERQTTFSTQQSAAA